MAPRPTAHRRPPLSRPSVGRTVNRRKSQFDRPLASRRNGAVETKPQRRVIAVERHFDHLAGQRSRFAVEPQLCRPSGPVGRAARAACRIARGPCETAVRGRGLFWLFLLFSAAKYQSSLNSRSARLSALP